MKEHVCCVLAGVALLAACQKKETAVTNPPAENKTESNTTIVDQSTAPSPAENKTESNTTIVDQSTASSPTGNKTETDTTTSNQSSRTETNLPTETVNGSSVPTIPEENRTIVTEQPMPAPNATGNQSEQQRKLMLGRLYDPSTKP